jgi:hypothetical protein
MLQQARACNKILKQMKHEENSGSIKFKIREWCNIQGAVPPGMEPQFIIVARDEFWRRWREVGRRGVQNRGYELQAPQRSQNHICSHKTRGAFASTMTTPERLSRPFTHLCFLAIVFTSDTPRSMVKSQK